MEIQKTMLDMMKWFHQFCISNNINYYVVGGTMLGAVRHQGFIPWDDDIDVGIPRKDYNRLMRDKDGLLKNEEKYSIESYLDGEKDYEYPNAKVFDKHTTLIENNRLRTKRGVFIDVFPLDGIGQSKEEAMRNFSPIQKKLNFLMARTCELRKERKLKKNIAIIIARILPQCIYSNKTLLRSIDKLCEERSFDNSNYVGNLVGNWGIKEIMPKEYFGKPKLYKFECTEVYGPEKYDDYLTNIYKDWRQMPPIEKQKSHHDYLFLDLHKSYLD